MVLPEQMYSLAVAKKHLSSRAARFSPYVRATNTDAGSPTQMVQHLRRLCTLMDTLSGDKRFRNCLAFTTHAQFILHSSSRTIIVTCADDSRFRLTAEEDTRPVITASADDLLTCAAEHLGLVPA